MESLRMFLWLFIIKRPRIRNIYEAIDRNKAAIQNSFNENKVKYIDIFYIIENVK